VRSIRRTLLLGLLSSVLLAVAAAAVVSYVDAREQANRLFDGQLQQVAEAFPSYALSPQPAVPLDDVVAQGQLVIQVFRRDPLAMVFSNALLAPPEQPRSGFTTVWDSAQSWRVYTRVGPFDVVQVAQPMSVRSRQAAAVALRTVLPFLLLLPALGALVWVVVSRGLAPLDRVAVEVSTRSPDALQPIAQRGLPQEVRPLIGSLNALLERLSQALEAQRGFVGDAAHALRTPVAALQLQAELLERAQTEDERTAAAASLHDGLERVRRLVAQLLVLARQDGAHAPRTVSPVALDALAAEVVGEQAVLAEAKNIDLGLMRVEPVGVVGDRDSLRILLSNLVDNAIRYTPAGGRVDVAVERRNDAAVLSVEDSGPGIAPEHRAQVFDRFYRVQQTGTGSGLGLAIVQNIAERHDARVVLDTARNGHGLLVRVCFPPEPWGRPASSGVTDWE
jgi:two-component system OmpR family sensor kinase